MKWKALLVAVMMLVSFKAFAAAPDLTIASVSGFPGQTIQVPITADLTTPIGAYQFNLQYDPNLLTLVSVTNGSATTTWNILDNPNNPFGRGPGNVMIGSYSTTTITGNAQQIAIVTFTVNSTPGTATITPPNFVLSVPLFNETAPSVINGTFALQILGDINGDGKVTIADAALVAQSVVGLITLTTQQTQAAEVTNSGKVDLYDAALIAEYAAGIITQL